MHAENSLNVKRRRRQSDTGRQSMLCPSPGRTRTNLRHSQRRPRCRRVDPTGPPKREESLPSNKATFQCIGLVDLQSQHRHIFSCPVWRTWVLLGVVWQDLGAISRLPLQLERIDRGRPGLCASLIRQRDCPLLRAECIPEASLLCRWPLSPAPMLGFAGSVVLRQSSQPGQQIL